MAIICCCLHIRDQEEDVSPRQNRPGLSSIIHALLAKFTAMFGNEQLGAPPATSMAQTAASSDSNAASNNAIHPNIATSSPTTLHFDTDAATFSGQQQRDTKRDSEGNESAELQSNCSRSELKLSSDKAEAQVANASDLSEEEDVCPTCLEEYYPENPMIVLQCSHTYHLSCIYEWMERSEKCPICSKVMIFHEAA